MCSVSGADISSNGVLNSKHTQPMCTSQHWLFAIRQAEGQPRPHRKTDVHMISQVESVAVVH